VIIMNVYRISGKFLMGRKYQVFTKEMIGKGKSEALERLYSIIGSKHNVERRYIKVEKITQIKPESAEDPLVRYKVGVKNE